MGGSSSAEDGLVCLCVASAYKLVGSSNGFVPKVNRDMFSAIYRCPNPARLYAAEWFFLLFKELEI